VNTRGRRLLWASLSLLPAHVAHAAPGDATRLEYARSAAAESCPDRTALRQAVASRLGYDPFFPVARQAVVVEISDDGQSLKAAMRLLDEGGIIRGGQELRAPLEHCDELVRALALAISIALDPSSAFESHSEPPPERDADDAEPGGNAAVSPRVEPTAPVDSPQPRAVGPAPVRKSRAEPLHFAASATGFAVLGNAPALAAGGALGARVRGSFWSLGVELGGQLPTSAAVTAGAEAKVSELLSSLSPCVVGGIVSGCALAKLSSLQTEGFGVESPQRERTLQLALGLRGEVAPRLSRRLSLLVRADVLKPLFPVTLRIREVDVWRWPVVSAAFGLGLLFEFS
jgi:hypothetical protein